MAAEEGKDWLGWTTGEQQAERYDLSKQVGSVNWHPDEGVLQAWDNKVSSEKLFEKHNVKQNDLADYIGKEAAEKLIKAKPNREGWRELHNADLKVGGEGMKGFYDKILVDYANKFGKKFGAKVENRKIASRNEGETLGEFKERTGLSGNEAREQFLKKTRDAVTIHSLPITPEMKKSVLQEGVSLFSPAAEPKQPSQTASPSSMTPRAASPARLRWLAARGLVPNQQGQPQPQNN
jgi:hypothetical protein